MAVMQVAREPGTEHHREVQTDCVPNLCVSRFESPEHTSDRPGEQEIIIAL